jgi:hypothetical protein
MAQKDGEWRCLRCRREDVTAEASERAAAGANAGRRRALTEFELLRDPAASDRLIAKRAKCPTAFVPPVRAALRKAGRLAPLSSSIAENEP